MVEIEIEVYSDEIILPRDFNGRKRNIIALGCLFVPRNKKEEFLTTLTNARCLYEKSNKWVWEHQICPFCAECKRAWHEQNNCEIHHEEIRSARSSHSKIEISKRWLRYLISHNKSNKELVYFNILYIDLNKLQLVNFGTEKTHENIYNKFFRTTIHFGAKAFFGKYQSIIIKKVYHDSGPIKYHKFFPFLNLQKLSQDTMDKIRIDDFSVQFIDSDHKKYLANGEPGHRESQFIQFIDLVLGAFTQNLYYLSDDATKKELAMIIRPLINDMAHQKKLSEYNYF